ncbi:MAG: type I methionyl aminopeptidase [Patescibacteria group bacterium]
MKLKSPEDIRKLREGGKILNRIVRQVADRAKPGVSPYELEELANQLIKESGGVPSFKGFNGYPAATCISVNEVVVHGIPDPDVTLVKGDIVGIDIGLKYRGLFTDHAITVPVGTVSPQARKLLSVTAQALSEGVGAVKPGCTVGDIGNAIQSYVEGYKFGVVRSLVGHGVGFEVHEEPRVPNFGDRGTGPKLQPGAVIAIEPMVTLGSYEVTTKDDGWTIVTADGSLSAHFEHTIAVTHDGCIIITAP